MSLTVRLSPITQRALNALAKRKRLSRSEVVREALAHYAASEEAETTDSGPYHAWIDVVGVVQLGARDPSLTTGEQFAAALRKGPRARRAR